MISYFNSVAMFFGYLFLFLCVYFAGVYVYMKHNGTWDEDHGSDQEHTYDPRPMDEAINLCRKLESSGDTRKLAAQQIGVAIVEQDSDLINKIKARIEQLLQQHKKGTQS